MRVVIQRVSKASVTVEGAVRAEIGQGLMVLVGLFTGDDEAQLAWMADKLPDLRIFEDAQGKMNLSVRDVGGGILLVPNFTLAGDARKGRRPGFDQAMRPELSQPMFEKFAAMVAAHGVPVQTGVFRAHMDVALVNDGPITLVLDAPSIATSASPVAAPA
ncbi:MAG: D-aminoacyl-tRNA deacylase [Phycisphaerales bacterium]